MNGATFTKIPSPLELISFLNYWFLLLPIIVRTNHFNFKLHDKFIQSCSSREVYRMLTE